MRFLIIPLVLALTACSLDPNLKKPTGSVLGVYPSIAERPVTLHAVPNLGWRSMFKDPRLQRMIELALANNHDLQLAMLNAEAVRAQYNVQRSAQLPSFEAGAAGTRQRLAGASTLGQAGAKGVDNSYNVNMGLSAFEIDLFGRLRSLSKAAKARYLASEEGRRAAQITLVAGVADAYFAERLADGQLALTRRTLADWKQALFLTKRLHEAKQGSGLDVASAEGQVASAEADLEARYRNLATARNALQLLIAAQLPSDLPAGLPLTEQKIIQSLPAGLPSELLTRRPDVRRAEQELEAANADIGAARAAFFPRLSLTASVGYASSDLGHLFNGDQRIWSFSPQITQPLFQGGRLKAELKLAKIRKQAAVVEYEKVIETGFREVADGLAAAATYDRQIAAQERLVASAEKRRQLSELRYLAGQDSRLELLDAQREVFTARQGALELQKEEFAAATALYAALGGGLIE